MSDVERISVREFRTRLEAQGVARDDLAFVCRMCATIQSMRSLQVAGVPADRAETAIGFSCVGRFTNAGEPPKSVPTRSIDGPGCNWTLGGLFRLHRLEISNEAGETQPSFELATAEEAQALAAKLNAPNHQPTSLTKDERTDDA